MKARKIAIFIFIIGLLATAYLCWPWHHSNSPRHFWFDYSGEPSPGKRYWTAVGQTWVEQYESGEYNRFKVAGRTTINTMAGTVVVKTSGGSERPGTGDEGNLQVFIPDVGNQKMELWFRRKVAGQWQGWHSFAEMEGIQ